METQAVLDTFRKHVSEEDYEASATVQSLDYLSRLTPELVAHKDEINAILDLGCGYGGLTAAFADLLDCDTVHGIDLDEERRSVAEKRGVTTHSLDLESESFPFSEGDIDLVLSFGVLEHLKYYDHPIEESHRVLREGGFILYSVPNLGSWVNRIALLMGNQPRDVEISQQKPVGISRFYPDDGFLDHAHSPTHRAFVELLDHHGFTVTDSVGIFPYQEHWYVRLMDKLTANRPSLCRRIAVVGRKR